MDVYLVFSGQNPQVHAFCKAGNLRKWAVYINNEALSSMVISLPNKFLEFCVEKCQLLSKYQQVQPVHENLHLVPNNRWKEQMLPMALPVWGCLSVDSQFPL